MKYILYACKLQLFAAFTGLACLPSFGRCSEVVLYGEPEYSNSIKPAYALPSWLWYSPESIFYPDSIEDLSRFITESVESITPIGGSHGSLGYAFSGIGAAVSFQNISKVGPIDEDGLQLTVEAGALLEDVINYLNGTGYMTATGSCPGVGVSGWHLGGGYSMFGKKLGIGADNVKSMQVVLHNGTEVVASPDVNPDLFWAMRGAGHQSFGWLTSLKIGLLPLNTYVYTKFEKRCSPSNITDCADILYTWQRYYFDNTTWLESDLSMYYWLFEPLPESEDWSLLFVFGYLNDGQNAEAEMGGILEPFVEYLQTSGSYYYSSGYQVGQFADYDQLEGTSLSAYSGLVLPAYESKLGLYMKRDMDLAGWEVVLDALMIKFPAFQAANPRVQPHVTVGFEAYSGSMIDKRTDYNAHFQRSLTLGDLMIDLFIFEDDQPGISQSVEDGWNASIGWLENLYKGEALLDNVMYNHEGTFQAYVNYRFAAYGEGDVEERWAALQTYYGGNLCRLVEVKKMYDPDMIFDFPQGIPAFAPEGECANVSDSNDNNISIDADTSSASRPNYEIHGLALALLWTIMIIK